MSAMAVRGMALVAVQFALLGWLVWPFTTQVWSPLALAFAAGAAAVGAWTLLYNRPGNFNIRPEPKASGVLVTGGPYRYVRHPMYLAVLLFAAAETAAYADPWKIIASALLVSVLTAKALIEEAALRSRFAQYDAYAARVKRFIPGLF